MATRAKLFSQLAKSVDTSGTITSAGISSTVSLGATVYDSVGLLPTSGVNAGDQAFVISTSRLYINSGVGWYNVAVINNTPIVQSVLDSAGGTTPFSLATDGTPTTITITAVDSDGDPLTYSSTADSDFGGLATISQADNVFTITPFSQDSATTTSGTITFSITDGINIANSGIQTFTLNFLSPYWDETVLSIGTSSTNSLDNSTFIDRSTNAHTITPSGSPVQTTFHPYLDNWSVEFKDEGNDGWGLQLPSTTFDNPSSTFTVEAWCYLKSYGSATGGNEYQNRTIMGKGATYLNFGITSAGYIQLYHYDGSTRFINSTGTLPLNEWHHIAAVVNNGTVTFYIDGVSAGTGTWYGMHSGHVGTEFYVGTNVDNNAINDKWWDGYLSNVRFVDGTAIVPSSGGNEALTHVTNTEFIMCSSNRFIDASNNNLSVTVYRTPQISAFNPFGQGSEYAPGENKGSVDIDGSIGQGVEFTSAPLGSGDWTAECWQWIETGIISSGAAYIFDLDTGTGSQRLSFYWEDTGAGSGQDYSYNCYNNAYRALSSANVYSPKGQWTHLALVNESSVLTLYVNGVATGVTASESIGDLSGATICLGNTRSFRTYDAGDVRIADFAITQGVKYSSNFTPPTSPVGNTNASLYLPMDNAGIFDKTGNNTLTLSGDVATSTTQTKFASTSMYFDGNGDEITTNGSNIGNFGTGDFTIEAWIRADALSGYNSIVSDDTYFSSSTPNAWCFYLLNTSLNPWRGGSSIMSGGTLSTGTWHHVAWTRSSGTMYLFLDGTQVSTTSDTTRFDHGDIIVGSNVGNYHFEGYIEDLQILKGVAKYTTNFTPPTRTQGRAYQAES